jgi:Holliday junction resolvase-like predicted endonuclease
MTDKTFIEIDIEKIKNQILEGEPIEAVLSKYHWQAFESAIAQIFAANGFHIFQNLRFKIGRRYEIDIVASKYNRVLCVDCKEWRGGRYKKSALHKASEEQAERTGAFRKFVSSNPILRHTLKIGKWNFSYCKFFPVIVTLLEEDVDIGETDGVLVIPVQKLNSYLNSCFSF